LRRCAQALKLSSFVARFDLLAHLLDLFARVFEFDATHRVAPREARLVLRCAGASGGDERSVRVVTPRGLDIWRLDCRRLDCFLGYARPTGDLLGRLALGVDAIGRGMGRV
jgi:hypothetical protein